MEATGQRGAYSVKHGLHRSFIDDVCVLEHLNGVPQFVRDEREPLVMALPSPIGRHKDTQKAVAVRRRHERQQAAVQMTECAVAKFDIHDAVRAGNTVEERAEGRGSLGSFVEECQHDGVGRPNPWTWPVLCRGAADGRECRGHEHHRHQSSLCLRHRLALLATGGESGGRKPEPVESRRKMRACRIQSTEVTGLLLAWTHGDEAALDRLVPLVYAELRRIARGCMAGEHPGHTLQPTALINEAYLRLVDVQHVDWQNRSHFLAMSARVMRRVLVDMARARKGKQRHGGAQVTFHEALVVTGEPGQEVLALDDALEALAKEHPRKSRVIELRFFGGLTEQETASVLKVSPDTVTRDWRFAKAWLQREIATITR